MSDFTDRRVEEMVARQEVVEAIDELFMATDRKDWAAVRAVLAPEVMFDMSSAGGGPAAEMTGEAIADGWATGLAPIEQVHHQSGNHRVRMNGGTAEATCYAVAWHYRAHPSGQNTRTFVGSYDYELRRMDDRWRITLFRYHLKFIDGNRELEKDG
ncbi:MAG TPA: nuclear transport factor 2 family protein [Longimicrobium sp.]|nr:nuclear transport factor 2 family protein [Longimicrobium sp.]